MEIGDFHGYGMSILRAPEFSVSLTHKPLEINSMTARFVEHVGYRIVQFGPKGTENWPLGSDTPPLVRAFCLWVEEFSKSKGEPAGFVENARVTDWRGMSIDEPDDCTIICTFNGFLYTADCQLDGVEQPDPNEG